MCGLFGFITNRPGVYTDTLAWVSSNLASRNDTRGGDSWGITDGDAIVRGLGYTRPHRIRRFVRRRAPRLLIGHTRFATAGAIAIRNAHPFAIGDVIGAHNGACASWYERNSAWEVDSQYLIAGIAGLKTPRNIDASGVVTWYRTDRDALYLCHIKHGSICVFRAAGLEDTILWSSTFSDAEQVIDDMGSFIEDVLTVQPGVVYEVSGFGITNVCRFNDL